MAKPEDDFQGYMEDQMKADLQAQMYAAKMDEHEEWRQTTWGGFATRQMQALGNHFAPFFESLTDIMRDDRNSPWAVAVVILIRVLLILGYLVAAYALTRVVQNLIGRDLIIQEEEIIIVDEDDAAPTPRRSARNKKSQ